MNVLNRLEEIKPEIYNYITRPDSESSSVLNEAAVQYRRSTARIYHIPREAAAGDILASMDPVKDDDLELFHMPDLQPGTYFSIYARGDSMENTIYDGELLICSRLERLEDARDGYVHVICSNQVDEGFVVKRIFKKQVGGHVRSLELRSDNPFYPPVTLQAGKIQAIFQVRRTIRARFPPPYKEIFEDFIPKELLTANRCWLKNCSGYCTSLVLLGVRSAVCSVPSIRIISHGLVSIVAIFCSLRSPP